MKPKHESTGSVRNSWAQHYLLLLLPDEANNWGTSPDDREGGNSRAKIGPWASWFLSKRHPRLPLVSRQPARSAKVLIFQKAKQGGARRQFTQ